jgi:dGTPase
MSREVAPRRRPLEPAGSTKALRSGSPGLYRESDFATVVPRSTDYRSIPRRDLARLVHSPAFRRLQGKTQLFSGLESDFFRNRLTHSLEVAQIARSLAIKLNGSQPLLELGWEIDENLVELAGLAHDLGHPPFGHTGEHVLHRLMADHGGFEGNGQTLRILTRLEKKLDPATRRHPISAEVLYYDEGGEDVAAGLNLSARALASILKYDTAIPETSSPELVTKGYYASEEAIVRFVRGAVLGADGPEPLRTLECQIMDLADDIAYSTYDIEDAFQSGVSTPLHLVVIPEAIQRQVADRVNLELRKDGYRTQLGAADVPKVLLQLFEETGLSWDDPAATFIQSRLLAEQGHFRSTFTSSLVSRAIHAVHVEPDERRPALSRIRMDEDQRVLVSVLKHLTYTLVIESAKLKLVSHRGAQIVETIFETLLASPDLLPPDFRGRFEQAPALKRRRVVADFVAGMTDRYAVEFYARLTSEDFRSMFQPH